MVSIENWIATISAGIALASLLFTVWQAHQAKKSEEASAASAERSSSAAEAVSVSQARIAEVLEKIESKYSNPWKVRHFKGDTYALRNDSDEEVLNVEFVTDDPIYGDAVHKYPQLQPGDEVSFRYASAMGAGRRIAVQWTRPSESEPRVWNGLVPARTTR